MLSCLSANSDVTLEYMPRDTSGLRPWKPGQSGNPRGRPKGLNSLLREKFGDDAKVLVEEVNRLAFDQRESPATRFRMLSYLIDQHSGRPAQAMSVTGDEGEPLASKLHVEIYPSTPPEVPPTREPKKLEE